MKTKRIIKVVAFCLILFLFLNHIYDVFSWKDTAGDYYSTVDSLYKLEDDLVDVMFMGSSKCYVNINNALLWDEHGIASFNMSISGQDIVSTYHSLVEALKTQSPDIVCFELFGTLFSGYAVESNMYRNTLPYKWSLNALSVVNEIGGESKKELFFRWPIIHTRYKEVKKEDFMKERPAYLGYTCGFETQNIGLLNTYEGEELYPIGENEEKWLRKIIDLTKEKGIQLCFFMAPCETNAHDQMRLNYVEAIAKENNILMVNLSEMQEEIGFDSDTDFADWLHTNYWGAQKTTKYMGHFLKDNYDIEDRRGQAGYEIWEENSRVRQHEYNNYLLPLTSTLDDFFAQLSHMEEGYTVIVETNGNYYADTALIDAYAASLGIAEIDGRSGIWILENGDVKESYFGENFGHYFELGTSDVLLNRENGLSNIIINKMPYVRAWDGINVIVYDNILDKVIDSISFSATEQYMMQRLKY